MTEQARDRMIIALDVPTVAEAEAIMLNWASCLILQDRLSAGLCRWP